MIELFDMMDAAPPVVLPALLLMLAFGLIAIIDLTSKP